MSNFNRGNKFRGEKGGRKNFSGGGRSRNEGRPEMHKATCSDCGSACEVPFRPSGDKPIFCSDCFKGKRGDSPRGSRDGGRRNFSDDRGERDVKPRFDDKRSSRNNNTKDSINYKAQFEVLNNKLDKILRMLNPDISEEVGVFSEKTLKFEKTKKGAKQAVDTKALKKVMEKATEEKKQKAKKVTTKKSVKKSIKKAAVKKVIKKPTSKKKVSAKNKKK